MKLESGKVSAGLFIKIKQNDSYTCQLERKVKATFAVDLCKNLAIIALSWQVTMV